MDMPKTQDVAECWVKTATGKCKYIYIKRESGEYWRSQDGKLQYWHKPYPQAR
jgi:hypothetical protein